MPPSPLRIAIIGWGMAGPALSLALARRGQRVTAFERVEASQPVGAGILIQPTGM
jgi:2-polyprenyl-6-methoxyphenol hydroxylase-like FAD-dependent oxidoreductase